MQMVIGFSFTASRDVLLLEKLKPAWQKDKLNGVGGKLRKNESPLDGMIREFKEETGLVVSKWKMVLILSAPSYNLYVFKSQSNEIRSLHNVKNDVGETLKLIPLDEVNNLRGIMIYNLPWLINLCLDETIDIAIATANK